MSRSIVSEDGTLNLWAKRLHEGWQRFERSTRNTVEEAIALGRDLIQSKADVGHGQFGRLFSDHPDPVGRPMPFTRKWAAKLMGIARHPSIGNVAHERHLPTDINALDMLARLSQEEVDEAIETGRVTKTTTRAEVKRIVSDLRPQPTVEEMLASPRVQALAVDRVRPAEYSPEDDDHPTLAGLKRYWRKAGKRIKQQFLQWIKDRQ